MLVALCMVVFASMCECEYNCGEYRCVCACVFESACARIWECVAFVSNMCVCVKSSVKRYSHLLKPHCPSCPVAVVVYGVVTCHRRRPVDLYKVTNEYLANFVSTGMDVHACISSWICESMNVYFCSRTLARSEANITSQPKAQGFGEGET